MGKTTGGGPVEASNCLRILLEGDAPLQAELVEEGILPLAAALLKHKASVEAATRLLGVFDECFDECFGDLIQQVDPTSERGSLRRLMTSDDLG